MSEITGDREDLWLSVREAARLTGYNTAYLSRLAKKGLIEAKKSGRLWKIDYLSLKNFQSTTQKNKQDLREGLKIKRLEERHHLKKVIDKDANGGVELYIINPYAFLESVAVFLILYTLVLCIFTYNQASMGLYDLNSGVSYVRASIAQQVELNPISQMASSWLYQSYGK